MKANELMVGDLVKPTRLDSAARIVKIDALTGMNIVEHKYGYSSAHTLECNPIPLTPEILEKNGFYWGNTATEEDFCGAVGCGYPESGWCFDEGAGEIKILFPNETDGGLIRLDDQCADRHLELVFVKPIMVHELQHALRLCGIEKEVVL